MAEQRQGYVTDDDGWDRHPAFGIAQVNRVHATPGEVLFQSDTRHPEFIELTVSEVQRKRALRRDWVHPERVLFKVRMSMAQFASLAASAGTEGVPVTIAYDHGPRPGLVMESRLALTSAEVRTAAHAAFDAIQAAHAALVEGMSAKVGAAERRRLLNNLNAAVANAEPNVDYAARRLAEHAEAVVEKSRADIEAMAEAARRVQAEVPWHRLSELQAGKPEGKEEG